MQGSHQELQKSTFTNKNVRDKLKGIKRIIAQVNACKKRIARERDKLRDLISEMESLEDCTDRAVRDLESAADSLSEYM